MRIPIIQINQQFAKIGIDADLGKYEMRQPRADMQIRQTAAKLDIRAGQGRLEIDQSKAWDALGLGGILEAMSRIRSEAHRVALEGIARIAEEGDRLASIHLRTDMIAEIAQEGAFRSRDFNYMGPASYDNVDLHYTVSKPDIRISEGGADIQVQVRPPEISYARGKLDIYMRQRNQVEIIPPAIDLTL
ncbi:DUF6470 family protein [Paenibacillus alkalitolerans]|uniref:DUF6470 family protein n=1 Tax=Paenibacillus alkalitolerans TaxID=2799335 RepID=UPI001F1B87DE|nr:DUF6470 family protein [Paenibacillus alkalitolerans]